ncbi:MAG TPA: MoaD/ThiS family protein, partial [Pyrinomonadaceae bacterium]|nr:MoaD/ThiS family protein [Pyrinomonadaceae bacterium]
MEATEKNKGSTEGEELRVHLLFFGAARDAAGCDEAELILRSTTTRAADAFEEILEKYPDLRRFGRSLLFAVNQEYARDPDRLIREGDELAVFPPVSGGAEALKIEEAGSSDFFELTTEPIDVGSIARRIVPSRSGATVTLDGYVREW